MAVPAAAPVLSLVVTQTTLGWAGVALSEEGIRHATLFHHTEAAARGELQAAGAVDKDDPRAGDVSSLLRGYTEGTAGLTDYPVDLPPCTPLQRRTWLALRTIPRGETRSYGWLASQVGEPGKARIIGSINGANPIPLWLPCHRVIGSDGTLVGFGGGLAMKQALLELEGALPRRLMG